MHKLIVKKGGKTFIVNIPSDDDIAPDIGGGGANEETWDEDEQTWDTDDDSWNA